jgi:hypothetical protein
LLQSSLSLASVINQQLHSLYVTIFGFQKGMRRLIWNACAVQAKPDEQLLCPQDRFVPKLISCGSTPSWMAS